MNIKWSFDKIKEFVNQNKCELITSEDEFLNRESTLKIRCECNNLFETKLDYFIYNKYKRCPECALRMRGLTKRKNNDKFISELFDLVGDEYIAIEDYTKATTKINFKHTKCGYIFRTMPIEVLTGGRCPKCQGKIRDKDTNYFKQEVSNMYNDEYTVLGDYVTGNTKILMRHNLCGHEYVVAPHNFLRGRKCPKCMKHIKKDTAYFKDEVYNLVGDEYEVLGEYEKAKIKIRMKHNICKNEYDVFPDSFIRGSRCPICSESKGEQRIRYLLENNKISFSPQYTFSNLVGIGCSPLKFDFALFLDKHKKQLNVLIEYDGIFHYEKQYDDDGFETLQVHDKRKNEYCLENNIKLIRIPYWEFDNIESILKSNQII